MTPERQLTIIEHHTLDITHHTGFFADATVAHHPPNGADHQHAPRPTRHAHRLANRTPTRTSHRHLIEVAQ